jgi:hypothetical protein
MVDKTSFSDALGVSLPDERTIPSDARACVNCAHARVELNTSVMRKAVTCKALPKFPVAVPVSGGIGIRFYHPTMELFEDCDLFELKLGVPDLTQR